MTRSRNPAVDLYGAQYEHFSSQLYANIRAEAFGEDIGQNSWLTVEEHDLFVRRLALTSQSTLLEVACGSGGASLRIARVTGCRVQGVDIHEQAISEARTRATSEGFSERAAFDCMDAARPLPFPTGTFDALICVDAVNHLPDRPAIFAEWARLIRPGGNLVFTDPVVITGAISNEEIAIRSSIGFFLFVPAGVNECLLAEAGFEVIDVVDRTENMAHVACSWHSARQARANDLRSVEGDETFEGQQRFLEVTARLAAEHRMSRMAIHAVRASNTMQRSGPNTHLR